MSEFPAHCGDHLRKWVGAAQEKKRCASCKCIVRCLFSICNGKELQHHTAPSGHFSKPGGMSPKKVDFFHISEDRENLHFQACLPSLPFKKRKAKPLIPCWKNDIRRGPFFHDILHDRFFLQHVVIVNH